jgi:Fe-Mn family superoxide dismutase
MNRTKKNRNYKISQKKYKAVDYSYLLGKVKGIDDNLMKTHFKLYEGLVDATNGALAAIEKANSTGVKNMVEYSSIQKQLPLFFNGMRLHELYWDAMCGDNMDKKDPELVEAINKSFGSYEKWKRNFMSTGDIPAVGFAVLFRDRATGKLYNNWINEFNIGELIGVDILLVMDMWEHAYLCEFGLNIKKYQETFLKNVNWSVVSERFRQSKQLSLHILK